MYCEPEFLDCGATSYGWKGFGGLLFSSTDKLIPRYNLEAAWKMRLTSYSGVDQGLLFGCCAEVWRSVIYASRSIVIRVSTVTELLVIIDMT